eukprot:1455873-Prymnesium_polylepis.1
MCTTHTCTISTWRGNETRGATHRSGRRHAAGVVDHGRGCVVEGGQRPLDVRRVEPVTDGEQRRAHALRLALGVQLEDGALLAGDHRGLGRVERREAHLAVGCGHVGLQRLGGCADGEHAAGVGGERVHGEAADEGEVEGFREGEVAADAGRRDLSERVAEDDRWAEAKVAREHRVEGERARDERRL